jgi:predicted RNA-binding protein with PUA-like domain
MALWLFKQEPDCYSYANLERDGQTTWDGISNALALQHLRKVRRGDRVWFYQTGKDRRIVGEMEVISDPVPDPMLDDPRLVVVDVAPKRQLPCPVTLAMIKSDAILKEWDLVRLPRLSIVPVQPDQWQRVEDLGQK